MMTPPFSLWDSVVTTIGVDSAAKISESYRGSTMYVPRHIEMARKLIDIVGEADVARLISQLGGCTISVPTGRSQAWASRNAEILACREAGETTRALASRFYTSERNIQMIIKKEKSCSQL